MWLYRILWYITSPIISLFWLEKVEGKENIPRKGGVIIAPNHQSWIDPFFVTTSVKRRRFYFLAGEFIYNNKIARWALNTMDFIPVNRYSKDKGEVYKKSARILDDGGALVVFPEGRLTKDGYTQKGYKGVAKMALASKVDIVPTVIKNSYHVYPVHRKTPKFWGKRCCQVKYLKRLEYKDFKNKKLEDIVHNMIMKEIAKELGHEYSHTDFEKDIKEVPAG